MKISFVKKLFPAVVLMGLLFSPAMHLKAQEPGATKVETGQQSASAGQSSGQDIQEEADENDKYLHSASVRAFGAKVGLNPAQAATVFTVANFAVLAVLVGWFLAKSLPKTFRNRNTTIQKQLVDARTATEDANARLRSVEERLSKLDSQIAAMRAQAEKDSALDEQRIAAYVEEEKKRILASAEQEITAATALAQRQIQQYAAELAIEQAARKLVVTAETDRLLVQSFAQRLMGDDSKKGQN